VRLTPIESSEQPVSSVDVVTVMEDGVNRGGRLVTVSYVYANIHLFFLVYIMKLSPEQTPCWHGALNRRQHVLVCI
jgi:hypothetical protein